VFSSWTFDNDVRAIFGLGLSTISQNIRHKEEACYFSYSDSNVHSDFPNSLVPLEDLPWQPSGLHSRVRFCLSDFGYDFELQDVLHC
jgi:hypothetical protein